MNRLIILSFSNMDLVPSSTLFSHPFKDDQPIPHMDWEDFITLTVNQILKAQNPESYVSYPLGTKQEQGVILGFGHALTLTGPFFFMCFMDLSIGYWMCEEECTSLSTTASIPPLF